MSTVTPSISFLEISPEVENSRTVNDFEQKAKEDQQRRLKFYTDTSNEESQKKQEKDIFINLSLVQLFQKMSSTIINIINEILDIKSDTTINDIIYIFIKEDRLIYIGMLCIIITLSLYLIDVTS